MSPPSFLSALPPRWSLVPRAFALIVIAISAWFIGLGKGGNGREARVLAEPVPASQRNAEKYQNGGRIHVAAVQVTRVDGGLDENFANVEKLVREAAGRGARYILLPEYFPGQMTNEPGMTKAEALAGAQDLNGSIARRMIALCKELDAYVAFPLAERRADGKVYNSIVFAGPDGVEGVYSKRTLVNTRRKRGEPVKEFAPHERNPEKWHEAELVAQGKTDGVLTWGGVRIGALICADGGFPNAYKVRSDKGVQMFCHASGSSGIKTGENNPPPDVAARRYNRPVIFANRWVPNMFAFGNTQICDAQGEVLAKLGPEPNTIIDTFIDLPPIATAATSARADAP